MVCIKTLNPKSLYTAQGLGYISNDGDNRQGKLLSSKTVEMVDNALVDWESGFEVYRSFRI